MGPKSCEEPRTNNTTFESALEVDGKRSASYMYHEVFFPFRTWLVLGTTRIYNVNNNHRNIVFRSRQIYIVTVNALGKSDHGLIGLG